MSLPTEAVLRCKYCQLCGRGILFLERVSGVVCAQCGSLKTSSRQFTPDKHMRECALVRRMAVDTTDDREHLHGTLQQIKYI